MPDQLQGQSFRAAVDAASGSGDITAVAAVAGKRIAIIHYGLSVDAAAAVNLTFKSGSTTIGRLYFPANSAGNTDHDEAGMMLTAPGEAFVISRSAATSVGGYLRYKIVS